jgi:hypothetical protein
LASDQTVLIGMRDGQLRAHVGHLLSDAYCQKADTASRLPEKSGAEA